MMLHTSRRGWSLAALLALTGACADSPTLSSESGQAVLSKLEVNDPSKLYRGEVVTEAWVIDTVTGTFHTLGADTSTYVSATSKATTHARLTGAHGTSRVMLAVNDSAVRRQGEWTRAVEGKSGRNAEMRFKAEDGAPPAEIETRVAGALRTKVFNTWERTSTGWVLAKTSTTTYVNGRPVMQITRTVQSARAETPVHAKRNDPPAIAGAIRPVFEQASGGPCCEDEFEDLQDALLANEFMYAALIAACGLTGLGGCIVGAIVNLGSAVHLQNQLDDYNSCVLSAISNADCGPIAGWP